MEWREAISNVSFWLLQECRSYDTGNENMRSTDVSFYLGSD